MAEEAGFTRLWISDHFHPWNDAQDNSPFVRSVIGPPVGEGLAADQHGRDLPDGAHPPGRDRPGCGDGRGAGRGPVPGRVGSGEALNEHIFGDPWPSVGVRQEMLEAAAGLVGRDAVAEQFPCGPAVERHVKAVREFLDAWSREVLPQPS
ncbi:MAG: hypothetical protein QOF53_423 [Nocardioidaceae bacterium]|nr:hypothetical protein [Nocardioidaceae bacterium]